jgi:hypothetical protein
MYTSRMAKSTLSVNKKKMGRPATGHDPVMSARIPGEMIEAVEKWAADNGCSRSQAVAIMIEAGLAAIATKRKPAKRKKAS